MGHAMNARYCRRPGSWSHLTSSERKINIDEIEFSFCFSIATCATSTIARGERCRQEGPSAAKLAASH